MPPSRGRYEVVDAFIGEGRGHDHDHKKEGANDRRPRPGQAVGDVVAGSPGPRPGPLHRHGDSTLQDQSWNGDRRAGVTQPPRWGVYPEPVVPLCDMPKMK